MTSEAVPADFTETETFRVSDTGAKASKNLRSPVLIMPVVLFLILWFILNRLVFGGFGMEEGAARLLVSALVAAVIIAGIVMAWLKLQKMGLAQVWIAASPDGLVLDDGVTHRELSWDAMTAVRVVKPMRGIEGRSGASSVNVGMAAGKAVNRLAQSLSGSLGVVGRGEIAPNPDNPLAAKLLEINRGVWGSDETGAPLVGIAPEEIVDGWYEGRLGDWLRHFRPDLAAEYERQRKSPRAE